MEDQGGETNALSKMPSEIGIEVWKDSISVHDENAKPDCRCFININFYDGWAQRSPSIVNSGGAKGRAGLLHVDRGRQRIEWRRQMVLRYLSISQGRDIPKVGK